MLVAPCKKNGVDCTKRHPSCHSHCEEYFKFKRAKAIENEKIRKARREDELMRDAQYKRSKF